MHQFAETFPDNYVLQLAKIRILLNAGQISLARESAAELEDGPPKVIFEKAEFAINLILTEGDEVGII